MKLLNAPMPEVYPWARLLDPRCKLAAGIAAIVAVGLLRTPLAAAVGFAGALVWMMALGVPARWYGPRLLALVPFLAPFAAVLPLVGHGQAAYEWWGGIRIYERGAALAAVLVLKALTLCGVVLALAGTTAAAPLLRAAQSLRVPDVLVHMALLTHRHVFLLLGELGRLRVALRVRGYRNRASLRSYRTAGHLAGILLIRGHERGQRVGQAMRCRGFAGRVHSLERFHAGVTDVLYAIVVVTVSAALLSWDVARR